MYVRDRDCPVPLSGQPGMSGAGDHEGRPYISRLDGLHDFGPGDHEGRPYGYIPEFNGLGVVPCERPTASLA